MAQSVLIAEFEKAGEGLEVRMGYRLGLVVVTAGTSHGQSHNSSRRDIDSIVDNIVAVV